MPRFIQATTSTGGAFLGVVGGGSSAVDNVTDSPINPAVPGMNWSPIPLTIVAQSIFFSSLGTGSISAQPRVGGVDVGTSLLVVAPGAGNNSGLNTQNVAITPPAVDADIAGTRFGIHPSAVGAMFAWAYETDGTHSLIGTGSFNTGNSGPITDYFFPFHAYSNTPLLGTEITITQRCAVDGFFKDLLIIGRFLNVTSDDSTTIGLRIGGVTVFSDTITNSATPVMRLLTTSEFPISEGDTFNGILTPTQLNISHPKTFAVMTTFRSA